MATNFGVKLPAPPSFVALAFPNRLEDRNSDLRILNGNDLSILCMKLVTREEIATFGMLRQHGFSCQIC